MKEDIKNMSLRQFIKHGYGYLPDDLLSALEYLEFKLEDFLSFYKYGIEFDLVEYENRTIKPLEYLKRNIDKKFLREEERQKRHFALDREIADARKKFEQVKQYYNLIKKNQGKIIEFSKLANFKLYGSNDKLNIKIPSEIRLPFEENVSSDLISSSKFSYEELKFLGLNHTVVDLINSYIEFEHMDKQAYQDLTLLNVLESVKSSVYNTDSESYELI